MRRLLFVAFLLLVACSAPKHVTRCPYVLGDAPLPPPKATVEANGRALPIAAFVSVGDTAHAACAGTIVHLGDDAAFVLTARHCVATETGQLFAPATHFRVYAVASDANGPIWRPIPVRRVFHPAGTRVPTHPFEDLDWAILETEKDEAMRALPLGRGDFIEGEPVAIVTAMGGPGDFIECPHADVFPWGDASGRGFIPGHSGSAIVRDGKVEAVVSGLHMRGLWPFTRVADIRVVRGASIARVWE